MRPPSLWGLALRGVAARRGRSLIAGLGVALGVGVLLGVAALGLGTRRHVLGEVMQALPVDTVEVVPKTVDLGFFQLETHRFLGGHPLGPAVLADLAELPEVAAAYPKLDVRLPLGARGGSRLFGRRLYTDLFMIALPPELVFATTPPPPDFQGVPVVVSDQLLEIYNASVAPALGTPRLTAEVLRGFEFDLIVGRSLMLGRRGAQREGTERARVVGTSPYALRLGVTVPIAEAERLMRTYAPGEPLVYRSILLKARSPADLPAVRAQVRARGLALEATADKASTAIALGTGLATLVGLLILTLAALNIAHSFIATLSERRRELAVLRAVGATRGHVVRWVLYEAAWVGAAGSLVGVLGGTAVIALADRGAQSWLPDFPFKPPQFFEVTWGLVVIVWAVGVAAALLGALGPALSAARTPVVRGLAEG